jgi:hypothetical protein
MVEQEAGRRLELTGGDYALVSEEDYEDLSRWRWRRNPGGYAQRGGTVDGKQVTVYMHRYIMKPGEWQTVDHINRNRLDNRRSNLRVCTYSENCENSGRWDNKPVGLAEQDAAELAELMRILLCGKHEALRTAVKMAISTLRERAARDLPPG